MAEKQNFMQQFVEQIHKASSGLSATERRLLPSLDRSGALCTGVGQEAHNWILSLLVMRDARKPSEVYRQHLSRLVNLCVAEELQEDFYYELDEMNQFQMTRGIYRRSLRSGSYTPFVDEGVRLLWAYARLKFYDRDLSEVLLGRVPEEISRDARDGNWHYGGILAAQIDRGNKKTAEAVKEILLGERNTLMISYELIRGIVMSRDEGLYRVLGDFLAAAGLQEGARQAVCETMDAGRAEAFLYLFRVIEEQNLIRYSAVTRAVSTWIGIYESESVERIADKLMRMMGQCLRDPVFCEEQLGTEDSIAICCALWAKGFYDAEEAVHAVQRLAEEGTKNQMMIASYYVGFFQSRGLQQKAAKKIWFAYPGDLELAACYLPYVLGNACDLMGGLMDYSSSGCYRYGYSSSYDKGVAPKQITAEKMGLTREEAVHSYGILKEMLERIPKKGVDLHPCMLPSGYRVKLGQSEIAASMCLLAWVLQEEELLDEAAGGIPLIGSGRHLAVRLLLWRPKTAVRRNLLFDLLHNPETNTREVAYRLVGRLDLTQEEYRKVEEHMRYKKSRKETLDLLKKQKPAELSACIGRLLKERSEESHMGALELALYLKEKAPKEYRLVVPALKAHDSPTEKEKLMLSELIGDSQEARGILHTPGYGLYNPKKQWKIPEIQIDTRKAEYLFEYGEEDCIQVLKRLSERIEANKEREYQDYYGEKQILGNNLFWNSYVMDYERDFPFRELWEDFYKEEIRTPGMLLEVYLYQDCLEKRQRYMDERKLYQKVFGRLPYKKLSETWEYQEQTKRIIDALFRKYVPKELKGQWGLVGFAKLYETQKSILRSYMESFPIFCKLDQWLSCVGEKEWESAFALRFLGGKNVEACVQAYIRGIWDKELLYKAFFTHWSLEDLVCAVSMAELHGGVPRWNIRERAVYAFFGRDRVPVKGGWFRPDLLSSDSPERKAAHELYEELTEMILKVELKRGEQETPFSGCIEQIQVLYGVERLVCILTALGKEPLKRTYGYYSYGKDRHSVLCRLLQICHPGDKEGAEDLRHALKGSGITRKRLVEVAMYARQWIPLVGEYLELPGFQSGCYYFMAHTSEGLEDTLMSVLAKYTPLGREELYDGAFDVQWFHEAYNALGEKDFKLLYDAAKYSAAGSLHARARKYADAALGSKTFEELVQAIDEKRNKDLLMSLGLLPLSDIQEEREEQLLKRYQYIQKFKKESSQFGAQRRSSERRAVEMALKNLSINAGFSDVMRLILRMESRLTEQYDDCLVWQTVEDVCLRVAVDEDGRSSLQCRKDGKILKSVPAKYKKYEQVIRCKEACKKLREQYQRTRQMMEQAMEDGTLFEVWELWKLMAHPVVCPMISSLVYTGAECSGKTGFLCESGLRDWNGDVRPLAPREQVRVAHPWDFYVEGHWQEYQKILFAEQIRQPFKQVFRELYVKLPEELEKEESRLFAGYQIQPRKTIATLRGRRWVVDYECGLQKVCYKENMIAVICVLADWYSPGDVEAPVLESVEFYDRKGFCRKRISEIPERLYSEVMRDVDLAVSTAYVGGVDPEASHSTVEMRRRIIKGNLELFQVKNVRLQGNHALIDGTLGQYTVHLGSGVVHQVGNAMLYVLPVHSQHRGKIFLPFVDEDPKTAEILSKILMFAEDRKIKDPSVLAQIR